MAIRKTNDFAKELRGLPAEINKIFSKQERILRENWLDPRLHAKRVKELPGVYSIRVTRRYRALFYFRDREIVLFSIGHRKEIYG